jgi:hypothetical protein
MKTFVSQPKGAIHQQDMKLYAIPVSLGEVARKRRL